MEDLISPSKLISILFKSDSISMNMLILIHLESDKLLRHTFDMIQVKIVSSLWVKVAQVVTCGV